MRQREKNMKKKKMERNEKERGRDINSIKERRRGCM